MTREGAGQGLEHASSARRSQQCKKARKLAADTETTSAEGPGGRPHGARSLVGKLEGGYGQPGSGHPGSGHPGSGHPGSGQPGSGHPTKPLLKRRAKPALRQEDSVPGWPYPVSTYRLKPPARELRPGWPYPLALLILLVLTMPGQAQYRSDSRCHCNSRPHPARGAPPSPGAPLPQAGEGKT